MIKKSCEAAESIKDALLRMARVNCNFYLDLKGFLSMIIFKKLFAPITLLLCFTLSLSLTGCSASSAQPFSKTGFYFDTVISLTCYGNDAQTVLNEAFELCGHYENLLSYTKEGSDIWNINHANGQPVTVDSETASLLQTALYWSEKTDGLIDPTITPISQLWNFSGDPAGPVPKQSQINAQENAYEIIVSAKLYEQQKYLISTNAVPDYTTLIVSDEFYQGLTKEQQKIIDQAAEIAQEKARESADDRRVQRQKVLEDEGMQIVDVDQKTWKQMQEKCQPVYDSIRKQAGDKLVDLYMGK